MRQWLYVALIGAVGFGADDEIGCGGGVTCVVEYIMADRCSTFTGPHCHYPCSTENCTEIVRMPRVIMHRPSV